MIGLSPLPPGHPSTFQRKPVRPSSACHGTFSLPGGRSQGFASAAGDYNALFGLALAPGPRLKALTLAADERLVGSLCKRHAVTGKTRSDRLQAHGFRIYFTPLSGVLFTFPSRYSSTIGLPGVLSLGGWCRQIRTGLLRPRPTQGTGSVGDAFAYGAVTLCRAPFQASSANVASSSMPALQPRARLNAHGLGWPPFARRYSGGHSCFPLLRLLGCFGSPGSPPPTDGCHANAWRVAPFGYPRIKGRSRLPAEYRCLPRPSSPPGATGIPRAPSLACPGSSATP